MSLFLYEVVPSDIARSHIEELLRAFDAAAREVDAEVIESQVTGDHARVFVVIEAVDASRLDSVLTAEQLPAVTELFGPAQVRLVGAELADVKAARSQAGYLVEWDFPADLDMDTYLANKKAKAPKYAEVPEVSFLRTYVREDMQKCLCLYDAADEDGVRRARDVVDTPIDRLHTVDQQ